MNYFFIRSPRIFRTLYSDKVLWTIPTVKNVIYLTFDDGPVPEVTLPLLDILDQFSVKATFFCVGDNVFHHLAAYQEILTRGHKTGNHTYHHLNGWKSKNEEYFSDVSHCRQIVDSKLFRPPYGKMKPSQIKSLAKEYQLVYWSVLSYDFSPEITWEQCLKNCTDNLKAGNIYVFHDSKKAGNTMIEVIPRFIEHALSEGFQFEVIPDTIKNASKIQDSGM
ncbi:MAG: polysaccharide deacetylase family protein [Bacteroidales bacterium]